MRPKDRFLAALARKPVDRVPMFDFLFQQPLFMRLIGRTPDTYNGKDVMDLTVALGLDGTCVTFCAPTGWEAERLSENVYKDEWGTTFEKNSASWPIDAPIAYPLKSRLDLQGYTPPDPWAAGRLAEVETALEINRRLGGKAVAVMGSVEGPLTRAWLLTGYENICMSLYDDPAFVAELAAMAVTFGVAAITQMAKAGIDGIIVSEDLGTSAGGMMSLGHFRAIFKPALAKLCSHGKGLGLPVMLHSCGRIYDYLDDLAELDIDAIHPLQRTAGMDLGKVKREYGGRFCIVGNIDSSRTLPMGTPEEVETEVRQAIAIAGPGGGYILASDHSLHDGIPVDNILRMFEAGRRLGQYEQ
ncbi:MAG: hypothetical protein HQ546_03635 [Planctomycetes bacterium]|nr:hypothetical protein [Planctomycetota bacterium]